MSASARWRDGGILYSSSRSGFRLQTKQTRLMRLVSSSQKCFRQIGFDGKYMTRNLCALGLPTTTRWLGRSPAAEPAIFLLESHIS